MIESLKHLPPASGSNEALARQFTDLAPALTQRQAAIEAARCLYCYDAPCMHACPTGIDVASFIRNIHDGNINGAAHNILKQNIFGGACSRVCPTEILCEDACVRNHMEEHQPVKIGLLQRHAIDHATFKQHPFQRAPGTGKTIAVVGAGPAGLSCAHRLAMLGNDVVVFEANAKAGGLNEYGIAKYKLPGDFAQRRSRVPAVDRRHRPVRIRPHAGPRTSSWPTCTIAASMPSSSAVGLAASRKPRPDRRGRARPDGCRRLHRDPAPGRPTWLRCRCRAAPSSSAPATPRSTSPCS